jgi:hypothetical protein
MVDTARKSQTTAVRAAPPRRAAAAENAEELAEYTKTKTKPLTFSLSKALASAIRHPPSATVDSSLYAVACRLDWRACGSRSSKGPNPGRYA